MPRLQPLPMFDEIPLVLPSNPSKVVVSTSFGKDSIAALLEALETYGPALVVAHYQVVEEEWPDTLEYGQRVCDYLGVPLYTAQGKYYGYRCLDCGRTYLSAHPEKAMCRPPKNLSGNRVGGDRIKRKETNSQPKAKEEPAWPEPNRGKS